MSPVLQCKVIIAALTVMSLGTFCQARGQVYIPQERQPNTYMLDRVREVDWDLDESQLLRRDNHETMPTHLPLCSTDINRINLNNPEYDYMPPFYYEVTCHRSGSSEDDEVEPRQTSSQRCVDTYLECVQKNVTLFVSRRRHGQDCWVPTAIEISSGCECMWPVADHGSMHSMY